MGQPLRAAPAPGRWEIVIPAWHPPRLNRLMRHWAATHRLKRECRRVLALFAGRVPRAEGRRRLALTITLGPRQRAGDPDSYFKALLDACVAQGLLVDDSRSWLDLAPVAFARGPERATVIVLEDLIGGRR